MYGKEALLTNSIHDMVQTYYKNKRGNFQEVKTKVISKKEEIY